MKKLVISIFLLQIICPQLVRADTWLITSLNWQPYSGAEMINEGNSVQKLKSLLQSNRIDTMVEFYPWQRAQAQASQPGYFGYFPAWPEEVKPGFIASNPVDWSEIGVMALQESDIKFESLEELFSQYTVGVIRTYVYPEPIAGMLQKYAQNVSYTDNELLLIKKLAAKRHQVALTDPLVMLYLAEKHSIEGINTVKVLLKKPLVVAMADTEENKARIALFNSILK